MAFLCSPEGVTGAVSVLAIIAHGFLLSGVLAVMPPVQVFETFRAYWIVLPVIMGFTLGYGAAAIGAEVPVFYIERVGPSVIMDTAYISTVIETLNAPGGSLR